MPHVDTTADLLQRIESGASFAPVRSLHDSQADDTSTRVCRTFIVCSSPRRLFRQLMDRTITAIVLTIAVVVGRAVAETMGAGTLAFALSFAGGAVLASLADTLMPEAFEHGRPFNAMSTALGFLLAFVLSEL